MRLADGRLAQWREHSYRGRVVGSLVVLYLGDVVIGSAQRIDGDVHRGRYWVGSYRGRRLLRADGGLRTFRHAIGAMVAVEAAVAEREPTTRSEVRHG